MSPDELMAFIERHSEALTLEAVMDLARLLGFRLKVEVVDR
jgi:hypothetical protein